MSTAAEPVQLAQEAAARAAQQLAVDGLDHEVRAALVAAEALALWAVSGELVVVVRGGLVQNDPVLPVLDLDVLDSDGPFDQEMVDEVAALWHRAHGLDHSEAMREAERWLDQHARFELDAPMPGLGVWTAVAE